ncbi:MAG: AmmeMemoRadiSam system protein A [Terriglobales bacterium]
MSRSSPTPSASPSENLAAREKVRATPPSSELESEFSLEQRRILLGIAHQAILSALEDQDLHHRGHPSTPPSASLGASAKRAGSETQGKTPLVLEAPASALLSEPRGVFTTLYLEGELRGCVGYVAPVVPLYRAVAETARAAAFEDSRFLPVTREEGLRLEVSLSALSRLSPVPPDAVEVGRHGLVISLGGRRGLLLPQVAVEHGWGRETFLEQTCRKAGLPLDAWRKGATIEAFTAEVFSDNDAEDPC